MNNNQKNNLLCGSLEAARSTRAGMWNKSTRCGRLVLAAALAFVLVSSTGCGTYPRPRLRLGAYFGAPLGIDYPDPDNLGKHDYYNWWDEKIGLVYTSRGGFIDIGHVRDSADRTAYCTLTTYKNLMKGKTEFSFRLLEPSKYIVTVKYPDNWNSLPDSLKEQITQDVALGAGQYFAYNAMVWHEIITWYGYKCTGIFSEYISSFSWEDVYSDGVGVDIASRALKESTDNFDEVMTNLIYDELAQLGAQPVSIAKEAEKKISGKWFNGSIYPFAKLKKRNFDIGYDDGRVTPWLVPGIPGNKEPLPQVVPNLSFLERAGFSIDVKIEPRIMEEHKIFKVVSDSDGKYIVPARDFPVIMNYITRKEMKRNGPEVNIPSL